MGHWGLSLPGVIVLPTWFRWSILTMILWGSWGVIAKLAGADARPIQIQSMLGLGMVPLAGYLFWRGVRDSDRPPAPKNILLGMMSGGLGAVGNMACFDAMDAGGKAAAVVPLAALYPYMTAAMAIVLLRESLAPRQWAGLGFAAASMIVFSGAGKDLFSYWFLVAVLPIAVWGVGAFLVKLATRSGSERDASFGYMLTQIAASVVALSARPDWRPTSPHAAGLSLVLGMMSAMGTYTFAAALASGGKAAIVTPLCGLYPMVTIAGAVMFLGEHLEWHEVAGASLAIVAILAMTAPTSSTAPASPTSLDTST